MLSITELEEYFAVHKLPEAAREYVRFTRESPSRLVGEQARSNVCTWFMSRKTNQSIQTESRTGEYALALELEYAADVLEFWDQPPPLSVIRTYKNGRKMPGSYTPDLLAMRHAGPEVLEVKAEQEIQRLLQKHPDDWQQTATGVAYLPAKKALDAIGLRYRVVSTATLNPFRTSNLRLLLSAREADIDISSIHTQATAVLEKSAWIRLSQLAEAIGIADLTPLLLMIDHGLLYASLDDELLAQPESAWVASSPDFLRIAKESTTRNPWHGNPDDSPRPVDLGRVPSQKQASRALTALKRIAAEDKSRSVRRWKAKIRRGLAEGLTEFQSLTPQNHRSGNREPRLYEAVERFLDSFIRGEYPMPAEPPISTLRGYKLYAYLAEKSHPIFPPVSRPTFLRRIKLHDQSEVARQSGGRRAANAAAPPSDVLLRQLKPVRQFELGTMDHYLADVWCLLTANQRTSYRARPWISVLLDVGTGELLAFWLSFRHPSRRACAMVMRQCVRRHGRLPEEIIVDHGPEFISVYFHALAAHCRVNLVLRPAENPRYGSEAERIFGIFKTEWLSHRPGNTTSTRVARAASASHAPQNRAELTIEGLLSELIAFVDWYNANPRALRTAPSELARLGLQRFPSSGRAITFNNDFMIATAVETVDYSIDPRRGLHVPDTGLHYWHPVLARIGATKGGTEVRKEPEDPYRVYARAGTEWLTCLASRAREFDAKDPVLRLADAIRILDGAETRERAKKDADYALIDHLRTIDETRTAKETPVSPAGLAQNQGPTKKSVFEALRSIDLEPLKPAGWDE